jgi:nucleoside-diphosphate-sugar epimerase
MMTEPIGRALLTGVTGFVGSHLARALLDDGIEVHALVREGAHLERVPDLAGRVVVHVDDGRSLDTIVDAAAPDAAFHLATNFVAEHTPADVAALVADNVAFPTRLADALAAAGVRPFVNVGTAWQHVGGAAYRPKNLYAATKQAFEDVLTYYAERDGLRVVTVKLYDTYGPADHRGKLVDALVRAAVNATPLDMTSGNQLIDLVHVRDAVAALRLAADLAAAAPGQAAYAVSSGQPRTLRQLVELIGDVAGRPVSATWGARPDREGEMLEHWNAGPPPPGWRATVDLADGLRELVERSAAP